MSKFGLALFGIVLMLAGLGGFFYGLDPATLTFGQTVMICGAVVFSAGSIVLALGAVNLTLKRLDLPRPVAGTPPLDKTIAETSTTPEPQKPSALAPALGGVAVGAAGAAITALTLAKEKTEAAPEDKGHQGELFVPQTISSVQEPLPASPQPEVAKDPVAIPSEPQAVSPSAAPPIPTFKDDFDIDSALSDILGYARQPSEPLSVEPIADDEESMIETELQSWLDEPERHEQSLDSFDLPDVHLKTEQLVSPEAFNVVANHTSLEPLQEDLPTPGPVIAPLLREGVIAGVPFRLYGDGTVVAGEGERERRFTSLKEFRDYVDG